MGLSGVNPWQILLFFLNTCQNLDYNLDPPQPQHNEYNALNYKIGQRNWIKNDNIILDYHHTDLILKNKHIIGRWLTPHPKGASKLLA
jgi:hypothetical protein